MSGGDADGTSRCCREPKRAILPWRAHSFTIVRNGYRLCRAFHPAPLQRRAAPQLCEIRRASLSAMALLSRTGHTPVANAGDGADEARPIDPSDPSVTGVGEIQASVWGRASPPKGLKEAAAAGPASPESSYSPVPATVTITPSVEIRRIRAFSSSAT